MEILISFLQAVRTVAQDAAVTFAAQIGDGKMAAGAGAPLQPAQPAPARLRVLEGGRGHGKGLSSSCLALPACC